MIAALFVSLVALQDQAPSFVSPQWDALELESKWLLADRALEREGWAQAAEWGAWLVEAGELELAELLVLYGRGEGGPGPIVKALGDAGAPQWPRLVHWRMRHTDSHVRGGARQAFQGERAGLALDWLERWPQAREGLAEEVWRELLAAAPRREDASEALPPWTPETVLPHLADPGFVAELEPGARAEPGVAYAHQIERELRALSAAGLFAEPWLGRVLALARHEHPRVRALAWLSLASAPAQAVPAAEPLRAVRDPAEAPGAREAALLALSQRAGEQPVAWAELHGVARERVHPAWTTAVTRLAEIGDGFALEELQALRRALADPGTIEMLDAEIERLRQRLEARDELTPERLRRLLERTAWVDLACPPIESARIAWTRRFLAERLARPDGAGLRAALEELARSYEPGRAIEPAPQPTGVSQEGMRKRVRLHARAALGG